MLKWHAVNKECEDKQKWGRSWVSDYIACTIDQLLCKTGLKDRERLANNCTKMLIASLVLKDVDWETIEHLNMEFVSPKDESDVPKNLDESLRPVLEILTTEFGHEVTRRINLSIGNEKIRTIPHQSVH